VAAGIARRAGSVRKRRAAEHIICDRGMIPRGKKFQLKVTCMEMHPEVCILRDREDYGHIMALCTSLQRVFEKDVSGSYHCFFCPREFQARGLKDGVWVYFSTCRRKRPKVNITHMFALCTSHGREIRFAMKPGGVLHWLSGPCLAQRLLKTKAEKIFCSVVKLEHTVGVVRRDRDHDLFIDGTEIWPRQSRTAPEKSVSGKSDALKAMDALGLLKNGQGKPREKKSNGGVVGSIHSGLPACLSGPAAGDAPPDLSNRAGLFVDVPTHSESDDCSAAPGASDLDHSDENGGPDNAPQPCSRIHVCVCVCVCVCV
jgi:hypothetical protein